MEALLKRARPIAPLPFFAWGAALFAVKVGIDYAVSSAFAHPYSVLYYVSPLDAPLMHPQEQLPYWLAMWGVALPFIGLGVWLTLRRLKDARLPLWLVGLFFVPFANLIFFLGVSVVPSRAPDPKVVPPGYRDSAKERPAPKRSVTGAVVIAATAGAVISLGMVGISVGLFGEYGAALFVGSPTLSAFIATLLFGYLHGPKAAPSFIAAMTSQGISFIVMLAFAIEGLVCLLMAAPLAVGAAVLGWGIAYVFIYNTYAPPTKTGPVALAVLPFWLITEALAPVPHEVDRMVESVIVVDAPPDVVWHRVLAFEELPPPHELIFRAGVSAPTGAVIEGQGAGAVRRCRFTTGEFIEPITVWRPGHELSFNVARQPDPMREMTPYAGPRPPHLDGYFATTRGQFLLEAVEGGQTRLRGRTWYTLDVFPRPYWAIWADNFIHTIHLRVMRQIAHLAEDDYASLRD